MSVPAEAVLLTIALWFGGWMLILASRATAAAIEAWSEQYLEDYDR